MLRNRLRTLEQQVNAAGSHGRRQGEAPGLHQRVLRSLTSFNVLFADEEDQFKGAGGD